ncbi:unnamed protein product, partial [Porites evermanni]
DVLAQTSTPGPQTQPTEFHSRGPLQPPSIAQLLKYNMYQSAEYRLRQVILWQYDKMVRPVLKPSDVINVTFQVDFKALSGVDNKDQIITTDTEITQVNQYKISWVLFVTLICATSLVFFYSADNKILQAGHVEKFHTYVLVRSNGLNTWISPSTFKSSCQLNVKFFPFDKQQCNMKFRSLAADRSLMDIISTTTESEDPEKGIMLLVMVQNSYLKLTSSNGYWTLRSLVIKMNNHDEKKEPKRQFPEVIVSFFIGRKPMFFVLFTLVPCMIIGMLILVSFFIPAESGERIGLCATILLAVSVYLVVITDQLPEQSDTLPLIGVYYIVIMFEIGLALAATVLVLMAHHATSKPPKLLTYLTVLNGIVCSPKSCRRFISKKRSKDTPPTSSPASAKTVVDPEMESDIDLELAVTLKENNDEKQDERSSDAGPISSANEVDEDEENQEMWKQIGRALDRLFFSVFLVLFTLSTLIIYGQAGRLDSLDTFKF